MATKDERPQFEQDLDKWVQKERPGCTAVVADCALCGFFGYIVREGTNTHYCPCCGNGII